MIKVGVYKDEWFPVYYLNMDNDNKNRHIEISESFYEEYANIAEKFLDCQDKLAKLYDEAYNKMNEQENAHE